MSAARIAKALAAVGATPEQIVAAIEAYEFPIEEKRLLAREKARQRKIRERERKNTDNSILVSRGQSVTERDTPSQGSDGFPPHPLSLTPNSPPSKITPIGVTKSSPKPENSDAPKPEEKSKGTRLPPDWELEEEDGNWAMQEFNLAYDEICFQADKFKDWWLSKAGAGGVKRDWQRTWRNWIREYVERKRK
jgi:hypothetical protein